MVESATADILFSQAGSHWRTWSCPPRVLCENKRRRTAANPRLSLWTLWVLSNVRSRSSERDDREPCIPSERGDREPCILAEQKRHTQLVQRRGSSGCSTLVNIGSRRLQDERSPASVSKGAEGILHTRDSLLKVGLGLLEDLSTARMVSICSCLFDKTRSSDRTAEISPSRMVDLDECFAMTTSKSSIFSVAFDASSSQKIGAPDLHLPMPSTFRHMPSRKPRAIAFAYSLGCRQCCQTL